MKFIFIISISEVLFLAWFVFLIKELLIDFCITYKVGRSFDINRWSSTYINDQLTKIFAGAGFVLISEDKSGLLVAVKQPCFWLPNTYVLQEAMWHGKNKKTCIRLLKEYLKIGKAMKAKNEIIEVYFSSFKDVNYERFNVKKISYNWMM